MATFRPLTLKDKYFVPIEAEIQRVLNLLIYDRLVAILQTSVPFEIQNAPISALTEAVRDGSVWYEDGAFRGTFSARISKELIALGAKFNKPSRTFSLSKERIPADVRIAQANAEVTIANIRAAMITTLDSVDPDQVSELSTAEKEYKRTITEMQDDLKKAAAAIAIIPELTPGARDVIAKEWGQNLDIYIKGWVGENVIKLREQVQLHGMAGGRAEGLVKMLVDNYGVSKSKAKFLARQETSMLMAKFHETRFAEIGITRYRWSTSHDERVRPDHRVLNGKIFSFTSPPITDRKTGARNNPGEDYNCRCIAVPIVE